MKLPEYMRKKIMRRAKLQKEANALQTEIDEWCEKHGIECEWNVSHVGLFCEPGVAALSTIRTIEKALQEHEG